MIYKTYLEKKIKENKWFEIKRCNLYNWPIKTRVNISSIWIFRLNLFRQRTFSALQIIVFTTKCYCNKFLMTFNIERPFEFQNHALRPEKCMERNFLYVNKSYSQFWFAKNRPQLTSNTFFIRIIRTWNFLLILEFFEF